jgi:hypothetical protein
MLISREYANEVRGTAFGRKPNSSALQDLSPRPPERVAAGAACNTLRRGRSSFAVKRGAMREGFQPSFPAKRHGNRLGFPSAPRRHGE